MYELGGTAPLHVWLTNKIMHILNYQFYTKTKSKFFFVKKWLLANAYEEHQLDKVRLDQTGLSVMNAVYVCI